MKPEEIVETYLVKRIKEIGGAAIKMIPQYTAGIPDRLVLYKKGISVFVELKAPGKMPDKIQVNFIRELREKGHWCEVIDTKAGVDDFVRTLKMLA